MRNLSQVRRLLVAKEANGWSDPINVSGYRHIVLVISTSGTAAGTIKVATSALKGSEVDFTDTAGVGNEFDYVAGYNYNSGVFFTGDTGVVYAGTDAVEQVIINTDHMNTLAVSLSNRSAGSFNVMFIGANDSKE